MQVCATPNTLLNVLASLKEITFVPFKEGNPHDIVAVIDGLYGFVE